MTFRKHRNIRFVAVVEANAAWLGVPTVLVLPADDDEDCAARGQQGKSSRPRVPKVSQMMLISGPVVTNDKHNL